MNLEGKLESEARKALSISNATAISIAISLKRIADLLEKRTVRSEHLRKLTQLTEEYGGYRELNVEDAR